MHIESIEINNFRLLKEVSLTFDKKSTVIVGRNNSGKTSLTELFRRFFSKTNPVFHLEDFSLKSIERFKEALIAKNKEGSDVTIREIIPSIDLILTVDYHDNQTDYGILSEFIIDLDADNTKAKIKISYQLKDGMINAFFYDANDNNFISLLKDRIPKFFNVEVTAIDYTDLNNTTKVDLEKLRRLVGTNFINAQRGLDDVTQSENDVLGKVLGSIFKTASTDTASPDMKSKSKDLETEVKSLQTILDRDFQSKVDALLPNLNIFGYPGLSDPSITTKTTFEAKTIIENNTKITYQKSNGIHLPETYNGLGSRNLIYILFQIFEFFREFQANSSNLKSHIVFIEEPEAHLHPQMQEIFIRKLYDIAEKFSKELNNGIQWPVQFIVSTHSTHIANEADFNSIRYFLTKGTLDLETTIKDFNYKFNGYELKFDREFIQKYMTLTKCDLFFADKAILIEGPTERILMPKLIEKVDKQESQKLQSQYISLIEIGGAYAHHFYELLDFLELKSLIITDLDSVRNESDINGVQRRKACEVSLGEFTSNTAIRKWFDIEGEDIDLDGVRSVKEIGKIKGIRRIAYQIPETTLHACGRSFEDAFILSNLDHFEIDRENDDIEKIAYDKAKEFSKKKTDFALTYALHETDWNIPLYIKEGLLWLANNVDQVEEVPVVENALIRE